LGEKKGGEKKGGERTLLKFSCIARERESERERERERERESTGIVIILCFCVVLLKRETIGVGEVCVQFHFVCCVARDKEFVAIGERGC
jgi:hypothetical protein